MARYFLSPRGTGTRFMSLIENAWAQAEQAPAGGLGMLPLLIIMFALMYFLIFRPQAKRAKEHQAMVQGLSKGDEVITGGGILGKITDVDEQFITLKVGNATEITVQRHTIGAVMPKGTFKDK